jgi:hypothetical protein
MQRSLNDFFAKNRNETVKRKHDSNSDNDSAAPNNNVTNISEPVPTPAKKPKWSKNFQIFYFICLKKKIYTKTGHVK